MTAENFLPRALFCSLIVHTAFIGATFIKEINLPKEKKQVRQGVEITYQPRKKEVDVQQRPIKTVQHLDLKNDIAMSDSGTIPVKLAKENTSAAPFAMYERKPEQVKKFEMKRRISITPIKSEKINNPAYASYNEMVRSRIEEKVYLNYDRLEMGKVYLTFVLDSHGNLKAAQIIPEKTTASQHLQDISLESLREASPFPAFLKGMTLPEYTFNIEIQYQVHD